MKMNQVWLIFRKDVRHQWIDILVSLGLVVGFVWAKMREWSWGGVGAIGVDGAAAIYLIMGGLIGPLLVISWMFLIVRAVHSESLAGDRQFWVTRPYDWKQLLAAKVLFVLVFVNIPLFLAQTFLVFKAGFHPAHYIHGLLWLQLFWILILLLPTAALAAVTRNLGNMLLTLLFVGLFAIGLSALGNAVPNSSFSSSLSWVYFLLIIIAVVAVILLQYSLRRTARSRWLLVGLAGALTLVLVAAPYRALIARAYPPAGAGFPLRLSLSGAPNEIRYNLRDRVPLPITLNLAGLPDDSFVALNGYMLSLRNSSGQHWDSGWQGGGGMFFPAEKLLAANFDIDKDDLDKLSASPVTGDLFIAFALYHDRNPRPFVVPRGEFSLPEAGFCASTDPDSTASSLSCRIALRRPTFLMVASEMTASTCPLPKDQVPPKPGEIVRAFIRGSSEAAEPGLSPILMDGIAFWQKSTNRISGICPGTPLTLSNPQDSGRNGVQVHIESAWFNAYLQALNNPKPQR